MGPRCRLSRRSQQLEFVREQFQAALNSVSQKEKFLWLALDTFFGSFLFLFSPVSAL
jgi:hypothetical protein